jgi:hypothetical protein
MGSTGSGRFSDYSSTPNSNSGGGASGGTSGTDRCRQAFSCALEEVAQCQFFSSSGAPPRSGTELRIVLNGRLFAVDTNGVQVGALPTRFNYLAACITSGIQYQGVVTGSTSGPLPSVNADFAAL